MALLRVQGLVELQQSLRLMSKDAPKELGKANKSVGQIVVAEAIRRAPRGPHQGGGQVRPIASSIHATSAQTRVTIVAGGANAPHAGAVEFGGSIPRKGFKGNKRWAQKLSMSYGGHAVTHVPRQSYLFPAVQAKLADVVIAYQKALDALIDRFDRS